MSQSNLTFVNYSVPFMSTEINDKFDFSKSQNVTLNPKITRDILKINEKQFHTQLTIVIDEENVPFKLKVVVRGMFLLDDWENPDNKDLVEVTSVATLFPYLRVLVSQASTILNMPPYILPLVNVKELFNKKADN